MPFELIDDGNDQGRFQVVDEQEPVRFMDEPTQFERFLAGVKMPDWMQNIRGTVVGRVAQGMADPVVGAVQTVANVLPDATGIPKAVNDRIANVEQEYQSERKASGDDGVDLARIAGNVFSPLNTVIAAKAPMAATAGMRALQGAGIGAASGAMQPVEDANDNFLGKKVGQVLTGAVTGGILTPALGAVGDRLARLIPKNGDESFVQAYGSAAQKIADALHELGQTSDDLTEAQVAALQKQVAEAVAKGKTFDAAAALRNSDFQALGVNPTLGQITRDPMQFAKEKNLSGVANVGEPLSARFGEQGNQLRDALDGTVGKTTSTPYQVGERMQAILRGMDAEKDAKADVLYRGFRELAPDVAVQDPARFSNNVLGSLEDQQVNAALPADWHKRLNAITNGEFPLTPSTLHQMYKNANAQLRGAQGSAKTALGIVKSAISSEMERLAQSVATKPPEPGSVVPFGTIAPEVANSDALRALQSLRLGQKQVAERYGLQDAVPALKAAVEGGTSGEDFVNRFIVNGRVNDIKALADQLKDHPDVWSEARGQIADSLRRAAFGSNVAGDAPFAPARYMEQVRRLGTDKLKLFFSPQEVEDILRVGRVGAYMNQRPNAAVVNTSGTGAAVANLLSKIPLRITGIPGADAAVGVGKRVADTIKSNAAVKNALAAVIPSEPLPANEEIKNLLAVLLAGGAAGAGGLAARPVGQQ